MCIQCLRFECKGLQRNMHHDVFKQPCVLCQAAALNPAGLRAAVAQTKCVTFKQHFITVRHAGLRRSVSHANLSMHYTALTAKLVAASSHPLLCPKHSTQSCMDCRQASTITFCRCFLVMPSSAAMVYKLPRKCVSACLRQCGTL